MENIAVINQRWAVYNYNGAVVSNGTVINLKDYRPKEGELLVVKNTPFFNGYPILLHGYKPLGAELLTVEQLCEAVFNNSDNSAIAAALGAEIQARLAADVDLQADINEVKDIALGANVALIFDNKNALDAWMAAEPPIEHDGYYPADLKNGWKALMIAADEPDWWWDGEAGIWREAEAKLDLTAYRTAAEQDAIDALHAPLHSPAFTGIPTTPHPSGEIPNQVATVRDMVFLRDVIFATLLHGARVCALPDTGLMPRFRATADGYIRATSTN